MILKRIIVWLIAIIGCVVSLKGQNIKSLKGKGISYSLKVYYSPDNFEEFVYLFLSDSTLEESAQKNKLQSNLDILFNEKFLIYTGSIALIQFTEIQREKELLDINELEYPHIDSIYNFIKYSDILMRMEWSKIGIEFLQTKFDLKILQKAYKAKIEISEVKGTFIIAETYPSEWSTAFNKVQFLNDKFIALPTKDIKNEPVSVLINYHK